MKGHGLASSPRPELVASVHEEEVSVAVGETHKHATKYVAFKSHGCVTFALTRQKLGVLGKGRSLFLLLLQHSLARVADLVLELASDRPLDDYFVERGVTRHCCIMRPESFRLCHDVDDQSRNRWVTCKGESSGVKFSVSKYTTRSM